MSSALYILRSGVESGVSLIDHLPRELALLLFSIVSAVIMLLVFRAVTPAHWLTRPRDRMVAAIYEVRLYLDSPVRVLRAQWDMIRYSFLYSAAMLPAVIVLTIPFGLALLHFDGHWGVAPLAVDTPHTVRIDLQGDTQKIAAVPNDCVRVTAPVAHFPDQNVAYVRAELADAASCTLSLDIDGTTVDKRLDGAATGSRSPVRTRGWALLTDITDEEPIDHPAVASISVQHEDSNLRWFGTTWPWWVHWLILTFAAAGFLVKPLKITL